jgi:hypothetical protein
MMISDDQPSLFLVVHHFAQTHTGSNPKTVLSMKRSPIAGMMLLKGQTLECSELLVQLPRFE